MKKRIISLLIAGVMVCAILVVGSSVIAKQKKGTKVIKNGGGIYIHPPGGDPIHVAGI